MANFGKVDIWGNKQEKRVVLARFPCKFLWTNKSTESSPMSKRRIKSFSLSDVSQRFSVQNNPHANVEYFRVAYSGTPYNTVRHENKIVLRKKWALPQVPSVQVTLATNLCALPGLEAVGDLKEIYNVAGAFPMPA